MNIFTILLIALLVFMIIKTIPTAYQTKARKLYADGDYEASKAVIEKLIDKGKADVTLKTEYAYLLLKTGKFEKAEQTVNNILCGSLKPQQRSKAVILRCICYDKNNNTQEAYDDLLELYNDGYRSMNLYGLLGYLKIKMHIDEKETYNFCAEAYDYADDDRDICDNMLICCLRAGEFEKARELSSYLLEEYPDFIEGYYHSAQLDVALKDFSAAKDKLNKVSDCTRSFMTTVSQEEIDELSEQIDKLSEVNE